MLKTMLRAPLALVSDPDFSALQRPSLACRVGLLRAVAVPTLRAVTFPQDEKYPLGVSWSERLEEVFRLNWTDRIRTMFRTGRLSMPALSGPGEAWRASFVRLNVRDCLIHVQDGPGLPAWVALVNVGKWTARGFTNWVLLPDGETLVTPEHRDSSLAEVQLSALAALYAAAGDAIGPWFREPAGPALAYRPANGNHLGHLVWNNLSGVHGLLAECETGGQPLIVYDLSIRPGADIYGSFGQLFPESSIQLRRPIDDDLLDVRAFVDATRERRHLLSFRLAEVPTSLRERIQRSVNKDMVASAVVPLVRKWLGRNGDGPRRPVLALGLRLQNRSVPDLAGFYEQVVRHLYTSCAPEGMFVVVDGMNAMPTGAIVAPESLIQREIAFVEELRLQLADLPVEVISCVGMTTAENLIWLSYADMFVAPQGGGLAKLRWVLNVPGYVLTSAINLSQSGRVFLYSHKGHTEAPAPLLSNRPDDVEDLFPNGPDGTPLISFEGSGGLSSINFRIVNPARILGEIEELFRASLNKAAGNESAFGNEMERQRKIVTTQ
ncbi:MAG: hypothetical protein EPO41_14610 [Reyranella sp.]|uniref:hypothetical protein n=1 Tax=Reyranella sp. TaxID=1929291 RepID=UPI00121654BE|nr:hypothetical protein [Reyranella sp.]TAJ92137.1 MAG: hypothetical protein EPO41_14610 [Reyranella sp.]